MEVFAEAVFRCSGATALVLLSARKRAGACPRASFQKATVIPLARFFGGTEAAMPAPIFLDNLYGVCYTAFIAIASTGRRAKCIRSLSTGRSQSLRGSRFPLIRLTACGRESRETLRFAQGDIPFNCNVILRSKATKNLSVRCD